MTWLFQGHTVRIQLRGRGTFVSLCFVSFHLLFLTSRSESSTLCNFSLVYLGAGWAKAKTSDSQMRVSWMHHTHKMNSSQLMALRGNSFMPKETLINEPIQGRCYTQFPGHMHPWNLHIFPLAKVTCSSGTRERAPPASQAPTSLTPTCPYSFSLADALCPIFHFPSSQPWRTGSRLWRLGSPKWNLVWSSSTAKVI